MSPSGLKRDPPATSKDCSMGSRGSSCWTPRRASNGCTPCERINWVPLNRQGTIGWIGVPVPRHDLLVHRIELKNLDKYGIIVKKWTNYEKMRANWFITKELEYIYIYWNLSKVRCKSNPSLTESMTNSRCMPVPMPTVPRLFCCFTPLKKHGYGSVHWAHILETWRVHTNNQSCYKTHTTVIDSVSWVFIPSILIVQVPGNSLSNCGHATCCQSPRIPPPLTAAAVQAIAPGRPPTLGPVSTPSSLA